jgi:hypothetical protein
MVQTINASLSVNANLKLGTRRRKLALAATNGYILNRSYLLKFLIMENATHSALRLTKNLPENIPTGG